MRETARRAPDPWERTSRRCRRSPERHGHPRQRIGHLRVVVGVGAVDRVRISSTSRPAARASATNGVAASSVPPSAIRIRNASFGVRRVGEPAPGERRAILQRQQDGQLRGVAHRAPPRGGDASGDGDVKREFSQALKLQPGYDRSRSATAVSIGGFVATHPLHISRSSAAALQQDDLPDLVRPLFEDTTIGIAVVGDVDVEVIHGIPVVVTSLASLAWMATHSWSPKPVCRVTCSRSAWR